MSNSQNIKFADPRQIGRDDTALKNYVESKGMTLSERSLDPYLKQRDQDRMKRLQAQPDPGPKAPAIVDPPRQVSHTPNPRWKGKLFVNPDPNAPLKWNEKKLIGDYARPFANWINTPERLGVFFGLASILLWLMIAKKRGLSNPRGRALALSAATGFGGWYASRPNIALAPYGIDQKQWAESLIPKNYAPKDASDLSMPILNKDYLHQAVQEMPGFNNTQRSFLSSGISSAPSLQSQRTVTTLEGLADGFSKRSGAVTGNKIGYLTRAVEGALIGSAFSSLAGLSPGTKKWVTGLSAAADSLYGNRLVNTLGYF